jgi:hypothetical protein
LKKLFTPICADLDRRKASLVEWNVSRHQAAQAVDDGTVGYCRGRVEVAVHLRPCAREVKGSRASAPAAVTAAHRWPEPGARLVGGVVGWLAGHAHLSRLNLRQWITIGVDVHSFKQAQGKIRGSSIMCSASSMVQSMTSSNCSQYSGWLWVAPLLQSPLVDSGCRSDQTAVEG